MLLEQQISILERLQCHVILLKSKNDKWSFNITDIRQHFKLKKLFLL